MLRASSQGSAVGKCFAVDAFQIFGLCAEFIGLYIQTTHPANPQYSDNKFHWKRSIANFSKGTVFRQLDILDFKEDNAVATVTYTAHITQGGQDETFTEKSFFEK